LVLAQGFFLVLAMRRGRGSHSTFVHKWLAISLFVAVFLLQHRTVWVAFLAALAVAALRIRGLATRVAVVLVLGGALGSYLILGLFAGSEQPSLAESLSVQTSNVDTFFWRVEGWEALLRDQAAESADEIAIGTPYGTGFRRLVAGGEVTSSPHNFYISTYLRQGILGLAAFLLAYGYALVQLSRRAKRPGLGFADPDTMLVLLVSQLTFFIAYAPRMEQGLILGLAVALARAADSDKPPVVSASRYRGSPTTLRNRQPLGSLARKLDFLSDRRAAWKMDQKPAFPRTR
jgi:O-antigen ligase